MKLAYEFDIMDMGDSFAAVPVGENASEFHAMVTLNSEGAEMLRLIAVHDTPEGVLEDLCAAHPEDTRDELGENLCQFLNKLVAEGLLIP